MIEARWADNNLDRLSELAAELVHIKVDVIVSRSPNQLWLLESDPNNPHCPYRR